MGPKHTRYALNVVGPFYVEDGCCTACGIPWWIAPELFVEDEKRVHCFVKRQPETADEIDKMLKVFSSQDLLCIRYSGTDPEILRRLTEAGLASQCDPPSIEGSEATGGVPHERPNGRRPQEE